MSLNIGKVAVLLGGLLAYQNRDKLADLFKGDPNKPDDPNRQGGSLSEGLQDILDRFRGAGAGREADSWVGTGPNEPVKPAQVESAISPEILDELAKQTGLSRQELLERLSRDLPTAVDKLTPNGTLLDDVAAPTGQSKW